MNTVKRFCNALAEAPRLSVKAGDETLVQLVPLGNPSVLRSFAIDHGILTWRDGELDIAPEWLFDHGEAERHPDIRPPALSVGEGPAPYRT